MIWYVTIGFALICALLAFAAARPDTFRVKRSANIAAPAHVIFPLINDFSEWQTWSPYEKMDLKMTRRFSEPSQGKGAVYEWSGNRKAGEGRMEIAHTSPPSTVVIRLDLTKPFETENIVEFTLQPFGNETMTTWSVRGSSPYLAKLMQLFVSTDRMVGKNFERGLANLKAIAEEHAERAPRFASVG